MTKFDKLHTAFMAWYNSHAPQSYPLYEKYADLVNQTIPGEITPLFGGSEPGELTFYATRADYLGRYRNTYVKVTRERITVSPDHLTGKVNKNLTKKFEVLYDQV